MTFARARLMVLQLTRQSSYLRGWLDGAELLGELGFPDVNNEKDKIERMAKLFKDLAEALENPETEESK